MPDFIGFEGFIAEFVCHIQDYDGVIFKASNFFLSRSHSLVLFKCSKCLIRISGALILYFVLFIFLGSVINNASARTLYNSILLIGVMCQSGKVPLITFMT